jgi:hypothetical protein
MQDPPLPRLGRFARELVADFSYRDGAWRTLATSLIPLGRFGAALLLLLMALVITAGDVYRAEWLRLLEGVGEPDAVPSDGTGSAAAATPPAA